MVALHHLKQLVSVLSNTKPLLPFFIAWHEVSIPFSTPCNANPSPKQFKTLQFSSTASLTQLRWIPVISDKTQSGVSIMLSIRLSMRLSTTETIGKTFSCPTFSTLTSFMCKQLMGAIQSGISTTLSIRLSLTLIETKAMLFVASASIPLSFMLHKVPFWIVIPCKPEFIAIPTSPPRLPSIFLSCKSSTTLSDAMVIAVPLAKSIDSARQ